MKYGEWFSFTDDQVVDVRIFFLPRTTRTLKTDRSWRKPRGAAVAGRREISTGPCGSAVVRLQ